MCVDESEKGREAYADSIGHPFFLFSLLQGPFPCLKGRYKSSSVFLFLGQAGCRCIDMKRKYVWTRLDRNSGEGGRRIVCAVCMKCMSAGRERDVVCGVSFFFHPQLKRTHKYALHASLWLSIMLIKIARTHRHCCRTHSSKHPSKPTQHPKCCRLLVCFPVDVLVVCSYAVVVNFFFVVRAIGRERVRWHDRLSIEGKIEDGRE